MLSAPNVMFEEVEYTGLFVAASKHHAQTEPLPQ